MDIPGISNYQAYIGLFFAAQSSPMIGFKMGGLIVFTGSVITAEAPVAARTTLGINGDTISFINGSGILRIYGLF